MVNYFNFFAQSLVFLFFWSCKPKNIILPKNVGLTNQLRIDGFYYRSINSNTDAVNIIFLYKNGVVLDMFSFDKVDIQFLRERIIKNYTDDKYKSSRLDWGTFELLSKEISLTNWYPSSGGPLPVYVKKGMILNDTTFVISHLENTKGKKKKI